MATTPHWGLRDDYVQSTEVSAADLNRRADTGDTQGEGALALQGQGVAGNLASLQVTAGSGLHVTVAAGQANVNDPTYGFIYLNNAAPVSVLCPANSTRYLYAQAQFEATIGDPDSRRDGSVAWLLDPTATISGSVLLAKVVTGSSTVTSVTDMRSFIGEPIARDVFPNGRVVGADATLLAPAPTDADVSTQVTLPAGSIFVLQGQRLQLAADVLLTCPCAAANYFPFLSMDPVTGLPTVDAGDWLTAYPGSTPLAALRALGKACLGTVTVTSNLVHDVADTSADLIYTQEGLLHIVDVAIGAVPATESAYGTVKLSVAPSGDSVAVGINDPSVTDKREPTGTPVGDLGGDYETGVTVEKLQGEDLVVTAPTLNDGIFYDGTKFVNAPSPGVSVILHGSGPSSGDGTPGDFYINTSSSSVNYWHMFYKSDSTTWVDQGSIRGGDGVPGPDGSIIRDFTGLPDNGVGVDGDYGIDNTNGNFYQRGKVTTGVYGYVANWAIRGADGGFSFPYIFELNTSSPASANSVRLNSTNPTIASFLYASYTQQVGVDVSAAWLDSVGTGDIIRIYQRSDPTNWAMYRATSVVDDSGNSETLIGIHYLCGTATTGSFTASLVVTIDIAKHGAGYRATSTTSRNLGITGNWTWATQNGLAYMPGLRVRLASDSDPTKWLEGQVTSYSGAALIVNVDRSNGTGTGITDWNIGLAAQGASTFTELTDAPASYAGEGGKVVAVKSDESGLEFVAGTPGSGASAFTDLTDAPASYSGVTPGAVVRANTTTDGLEFGDVLGTAAVADIGTGSGKVAAGDDSRFPTTDEKAALAGTGTPSSTNKYVTDDDTRLDDFTGDAGSGGSHGLVPAPSAGDAAGRKVLTAGGTWAEPSAVVGDAGSGGTQGEVPAPAAGDAAANKFLKADGTWATTPAGPGDFTGDAGSGGAAGLVPAPAAGDAAADKYLKADGTWATTPAGPSDFTGDAGGGGTHGLVPAPAAGDAAADKYLKADGTWSTTPSGPSDFTGDAGGGGTNGLVPAPAAGDAAASKFLAADGTWATTPAGPSDFTGDSGSGGAAGLVPAPAAGDGTAGKVLRADGTWGAEPDFVGDAGSGGTAGNVPAPTTGDAAAGKVLTAGGTWGNEPAFTGDAGSGGAAGNVPAPSTGDAIKRLKGDGTWAYEYKLISPQFTNGGELIEAGYYCPLTIPCDMEIVGWRLDSYDPATGNGVSDSVNVDVQTYAGSPSTVLLYTAISGTSYNSDVVSPIALADGDIIYFHVYGTLAAAVGLGLSLKVRVK